ncbi:hypothetical protein [Tenacibaculum xiamenense]|uniref:hypothetical protein n=1 Tax=Tenacibaculum xiamenense TaxID=1261553 RepID=UPI003893B586
MELSILEYAKGTEYDYLKEIFQNIESGYSVQFGTGCLKKGLKTPVQGDYTKHDKHKIVCILEGKVILELENDTTQKIILSSGDIFKIEKQEGHAATILENTKLIYVMFGETTS